ncbi:MAG: arginase family protein, partial [Albidovulum sp.]|uniref:arginase family protein n=1 Tax=Albidovulum sp. TaxID=1872424 RepID=UPI003CA6E3AF
MPGKNDFAIRQTSGYGVAPELSFGGVTSFLRRPYTKDLAGADVAVSGIPFDCATTSRPGTRLGPRQIREMSALLPWEPPFGWKDNPYDTLAIVDYGDC